MKTNTVTELQCQACYAPLAAKKQHSKIVTCDFCGTENVLSNEIRIVVAEHSVRFSVRLYTAIHHSFGSMDDLQHLITIVNGELESPFYISFDDIAGRTSQAKSLELVQWFYRRNMLQVLVDICLTLRPNMEI